MIFIQSIRVSFLILLLYLFSFSALATDDIAVIGLIGDKAILKINGVHHIVPEGESTPEGIYFLGIADDRRNVTLGIRY